MNFYSPPLKHSVKVSISDLITSWEGISHRAPSLATGEATIHLRRAWESLGLRAAATKRREQPRKEDPRQHLSLRCCCCCCGACERAPRLHLVGGQSRFLWKHMADIWRNRKQQQALPQQHGVPLSCPPLGEPWDLWPAGRRIQSARPRRLMDGLGSMGRDMINKCDGPIVPAERPTMLVSSDGRF